MKPDPKLEWAMFLIAVQFMTRLPVPGNLPYSDDLSVRSAKYYPLVGVLVGVIGALVLWLAGLVLPHGVAVLLSLAATLLVTGALHEDGLADAADGLGGGATRERAMEIMRDSRIGSYGVVTLGVVLALKVSVLIAMPPLVAGCALILGHALGRMAAVHVIATTSYARVAGNKFAIPSVTREGYRTALLSLLALFSGFALLFGLGPVLAGFLGGTALAQAFRLMFLRRLGGYTGDCLGGAQQLGELGTLLAILAWL